MPPRIPATIVTGFLGAGKTTLIRHMLAHAEGRRIALVINEFGELSVDGALLAGDGAAPGPAGMIELPNGCICCTVSDDFIPALERLIAQQPAPDHIVIETSGLALPEPLVRALGWPGLAARLAPDGVIAVVDGPSARTNAVSPDAPQAQVFADQLACADMIVLNKADLMDETALAAATTALASRARPGVQVVPASMGRLPLDVLLGQGTGQGGAAPEHGHHHHPHAHDAFESFTVTRPEIADAPAFAARIADLARAHGILRLKGFAAVAGKPMRLAIQAVGPRVETRFDQPLGTAPREARIVVIGPAGLDRATIERALRE